MPRKAPRRADQPRPNPAAGIDKQKPRCLSNLISQTKQAGGCQPARIRLHGHRNRNARLTRRITEAAAESDEPATVTELAQRGTMAKPRSKETQARVSRDGQA